MPDRRSKLSRADIPEIQKMADDFIPLCEIAARYKVHPSTISRAVAGKTWTGLTSTKNTDSILQFVKEKKNGNQNYDTRTTPRVPKDEGPPPSDEIAAIKELEQTILSNRRRLEELGDAAADGIERDLERSVLSENVHTRTKLQRKKRDHSARSAADLSRGKRVTLEDILSIDPSNATAQAALDSGDEGWKTAVEIAAGLLPASIYPTGQFTAVVRDIKRKIEEETKTSARRANRSNTTSRRSKKEKASE